jgi:hypothetical protein
MKKNIDVQEKGGRVLSTSTCACGLFVITTGACYNFNFFSEFLRVLGKKIKIVTSPCGITGSSDA